MGKHFKTFPVEKFYFVNLNFNPEIQRIIKNEVSYERLIIMRIKSMIVKQINMILTKVIFIAFNLLGWNKIHKNKSRLALGFESYPHQTS